MPQTPDTYSHSEVTTWNKCNRMWFYNYGMGLEKKVTAMPLSRGKLGHLVIEAFFKHMQAHADFETAKEAALSALTAAIMQDPAKYLELGSQVRKLVNAFFKNYPFAGWEVLAVEKSYTLHISEEIAVPVVVDLVLRDLFGELWVIDNKFTYNYIVSEDQDVMPQLPLYKAVVVLSFKQDPSKVHTAYSEFRTREIKNPTDDQLYKFDEVHISQARLERNLLEHGVVAKKVYEMKQQMSLEEMSYTCVRVKEPYTCGRCSFRQVCVAELNNDHPETILKAHYQKRVRRSFTSEETS